MQKVVAKIVGGVGNQLFQYCAGYACAKRLDAEFLLDISEFKEYKLRTYELGKFKTEENFALQDTVKKLNKNGIFKHTKFGEKNLSFDFKEIKGDAYLHGYFQSEKYFKEFEEEIRAQLEFKDYSFIRALGVLNEILNSNSVSISLRFGDYVGNVMYEVCKRKYYENCINYLQNCVGNCKFFVFSDDLELAKQMLEGLDVIYVESKNWMEDFYFIQTCKHNIIANSSFAWWGAWLNKNQEKIVCAPNRWYATSEIDYSDIVPSVWKKIEVN